MKYLPVAIVGTIIIAALCWTVDWRNTDLSSSTPFKAAEAQTEQSEKNDFGQCAESLWIDTVMSACGHSFGYEGDISSWGGWYFDTIPVGDDIMLDCDSVGPSSLKLSLVTRELIVDLGDPEALVKIKDFLGPLNGFQRFRENYEEALDTIINADYTYVCTGYYTFTADHADSCTRNAGMINRFLCELTGMGAGNSLNIKAMSDSLANEAVKNWKSSGYTDESSNAEKLEIRSRVCNPKFMTYSIYRHARIGSGHGMYTATFHTLDLSNGKCLSNQDIFRPNSHDNVKKLLFETMFNDKRYQEWNPGLESPEEIETRIIAWHSPNAHAEVSGSEELQEEIKIKLPEGALADSGVLFSFQPYEIDCWAAGAYHFIVPYERLMPYLTPTAKRLIQSSE